MKVPAALTRVRRKLSSEGAAATARHGARRVERLALAREDHIWYRLTVDGARPHLELPPGVSIATATSVRDVDAIAELGQDPGTARRHFDEGHTLWLAREGGDVLFACWIFTKSAPMFAAPGRQMTLWPGTVLLEDSFVSPLARGRGIAPASWSLIADGLRSQDVESVLTKVETDNTPSRHAVEKAGFAEIGEMHLTKLARVRRTTLRPYGDDPAVEPLARSLHARLH
jgi:GNAT superfamily N-acetyltransferase